MLGARLMPFIPRRSGLWPLGRILSRLPVVAPDKRWFPQGTDPNQPMFVNFVGLDDLGIGLPSPEELNGVLLRFRMLRLGQTKLWKVDGDLAQGRLIYFFCWQRHKPGTSPGGPRLPDPRLAATCRLPDARLLDTRPP